MYMWKRRGKEEAWQVGRLFTCVFVLNPKVGRLYPFGGGRIPVVWLASIPVDFVVAVSSLSITLKCLTLFIYLYRPR